MHGGERAGRRRENVGGFFECARRRARIFATFAIERERAPFEPFENGIRNVQTAAGRGHSGSDAAHEMRFISCGLRIRAGLLAKAFQKGVGARGVELHFDLQTLQSDWTLRSDVLAAIDDARVAFRRQTLHEEMSRERLADQAQRVTRRARRHMNRIQEPLGEKCVLRRVADLHDVAHSGDAVVERIVRRSDRAGRARVVEDHVILAFWRVERALVLNTRLRHIAK